MKFIYLLFSIYIIALSCLPCADVAINIGGNTTSLHTDTTSPSNNHHEDACSPFCACNCCNSSGFFKSINAVLDIVVLKIVTEKNKIDYTSTLFSNFHSSIWQPPQIS